MANLYKKLGQRIRKEREAAGLTQGDLADVISLSRTSITNIERGRQKIQVHTLYEIAAKLGIQVSVLLPPVDLGESEIWERIPDDVDEKDRSWIKELLSQPDEEE